MKAAYIETPGPPEAIRFGELPAPALGDRQYLVKVSALSVNPVDTYIRSGAYPIVLPRPFVIGRDMTGTVERLGREASRFRPGQRVWCNNQGYDGRQGTFSEYVAIDEELLYPLPDGVDEREAVAVVHSALTACIGLQCEARIKPGEKLFINGGAGNVGAAAIQIACHLGARVIATASTAEKLRYCLELGAERAVNYKTEDVSDAIRSFAPQGLDVHWDTSGHPDFERAVPLMAHRGRILVMAGLAAHPSFPVGAFYTRDCSMLGFAITNATTQELCDCAETINSLLSVGQLRARIDRIMPLAESAAAHRLLEHHAAEIFGKIIVVP